ncbi:siderophore-interacting protein [Corynebacterium sp. USCH3]|uniref:siderophore-interacting protein n=1 Tax=Corynebacterium sp. USCH3 TaxID=3024840 RepID=UPI00309A76EB
MTDPADRTTQDARNVTSVLNSTEHRKGLSELVLSVTSVSHRHPWLARVTGHVAGLADTTAWEHPNLAVRLAIPDPGDEIGALTGQPDVCRRVYTVAEFDRRSSTVAIDIVVHGSDSPMMCWLRDLVPGDRVPFAGPRPHPAPSAGADGRRIHLLADGSAYPAASAIARAVPVDTVTLALPDAGPVDRYAGDFPGATLHTADGSSPTALADVIGSLPSDGSTVFWAAGEREDIRSVRRHCLRTLGLRKEQVQVFGYWRRGRTGTQADLARLRAAASYQAEGRSFSEADDFDIEI